MIFKYCILKKDETVKSAAQKLFPGVIEGYVCKFTDTEADRAFYTDVGEDEDGLNYSYGDIVIEFDTGKHLAFTTSEWSRINIVPHEMIRKV